MPDDTKTTDASTDTSDQSNNGNDTGDGAKVQNGNDDQLGEGGKAALIAERVARQQAEREAKAVKRDLEALKAQSMSDAEKAVAAAKAEGRSEALTAANQRVVKAEIRAAATGRIDPALAVKLLDLDEFKVDDDGDVDPRAVKKAIDDLVKQYPDLATKKVQGGGDGGPRGGASSGSDMNQTIRERMRR